MKVTIADTAGFCFGVTRAVDLCQKTAEKYGGCLTLGPIIHNEHVVRQLAEAGAVPVSDLSEIGPDDVAVIRSHGITSQEYDALQTIGCTIVDATCPFVSRIHSIVFEESRAGHPILIVGEKDHPEVRGIASRCGVCRIVNSEDELLLAMKDPVFRDAEEVVMVSQTTGNRESFENYAKTLKKLCTNIKIFDTICLTTSMRQKEAAELSSCSDAMVVIGGRKSANTLRLAEICRKYCSQVVMIESADELDPGSFSSFARVGVTAGASTPSWIIKEVSQKMSEETKDIIAEASEAAPVEAAEAVEAVAAEAAETAETVAEAVEETVAPEAAEAAEAVEEAVEAVEEAAEEVAAEPEEAPAEAAGEAESFEEMVEKSIKTLHSGDKVTGIVAAITNTEVSVDLGCKHAGYIPVAELSADPSAKPEDIVKVGDEIEAFVMRVNDVEGTVMLSKKRLDAVKNWDVIEQLRADRETVEGVVTEENKGGVVVTVRGLRVFVPASQTGIPKDRPMTELLKQNVRLRITEVNQSRRRIVGSIRAAASEERKAKAEAIWNEIEVGKKYTGVVKSMTSYGAFVDIGGIDGMVHVSEISWSRIKQPSDVLSVGDEIEVYVISFDKEKRKISLGYKTDADNPWTKFTSTVSVGDAVDVKIVKLMPFGAFAEILPGVDGLIHISQIADHRIATPGEVLTEGQEVKVKVTDINEEKHKVSLSIRALLDGPSIPFYPPVEEAAAEPEAPAEEPAEEASAAEEAEQ